jgi:Protein of unknown function (DUF3352)
MRSLPLLLAALSICALALLGCGRGERASSATELAPAGAAIYAEFTLAPDGENKRAVDAILAKLPGGGTAGERMKKLIEQGLREADAPIGYAEDIEPWLGDEGAFFATGQTRNGDIEAAAVLLATEDEDKARAALEKAFEGDAKEKSYKDVDYLRSSDRDGAAGVVDGFVVVGTERGFEAAVDTSEGGEPLSQDGRYEEAVASAAEDRLGLFYIDIRSLVEATKRSAGAFRVPLPESFEDLFEDPYVATVDADEDGVVFEATTPESLARAVPFFGPGSELLGELPADSWVALAQPELGKLAGYYADLLGRMAGGRDMLEQQFETATGLQLKRDVLDWMGDFAIFARGTSLPELEGALVVETTDPAATRVFIARLRDLAREQSEPGTRIAPLELPGAGDGFTVRDSHVPQPIHVFMGDDRFVIAYGDAAAEDAVDPAERLGDAPGFEAAARSIQGYDPSFYLSMGPVLELVDSTPAGSAEDWQKARPYLEPIGALVAGTAGDSDELRAAFKIVIE